MLGSLEFVAQIIPLSDRGQTILSHHQEVLQKTSKVFWFKGVFSRIKAV